MPKARKPRKRAAHRLAAITFDQMFPKPADGLCRCKCGLPAVRTWASRSCQRQARDAFFMARGYGKQIRAAVFSRDKGICADCGMDTEKERMKCHLGNPYGLLPSIRLHLCAKYSAAGYPGPDRSWWQADHILPLIEGGGHGLDNLRTLCCVCHKPHTARLAARLGPRRANPPRLT